MPALQFEFKIVASTYSLQVSINGNFPSSYQSGLVAGREYDRMPFPALNLLARTVTVLQ